MFLFSNGSGQEGINTISRSQHIQIKQTQWRLCCVSINCAKSDERGEQEKMETKEEVVIVGAGIAGLATALALHRVGVRALVLERSDRLRATGAALTLFPNAWIALDALGVSRTLTPFYPPTSKGLITNVATGATQQVYYTGRDRNGVGVISVHRKALLEALAHELPTDAIRFSSKLTSIETQPQDGSSIAVLQLEDGTIIKSKILIGCDGVHSEVARWLGVAAPVDSGRSAVRGLATFPEGHGLKQEVQQFIDVGKRAGFAPLNDKEIYWFMTCDSPTEGDTMAGNPEQIQKEVMEKYAKGFPSVYLDVVRRADLSTLSWAPLIFRYPWNIISGNLSKDNITLAGDAMHPMTPDLAQGGCSALEDAVVLGRHIGRSFIQNGRLVPGETARAIKDYIKERRWRVAGLVTGSFLSGWVQHNGSKWWVKLLRDWIFYRFLFGWILDLVRYDCGRLHTVN